MARLMETSLELPEPDWSLKDSSKSADIVEMARLQAVSDALPVGEIVGYICGWARGDGTAYYIVTQEHPLTLQHVAFMDMWTVESALIRGLTKADIVAMQESTARFRKLFARQ